MAEHSMDWNQRYVDKNTPWDSGEPSLELQRVLQEDWILPGRVLEFGCGTGTNAIFLAQMEFEVTAVDIAPLALEKARTKAAEACVNVKFLQGDALALPNLGEPFPFVFDRGVYHHLREVNLQAFLATLAHVVAPGGYYLTLAGNANDPAPAELGPPRVQAHEICQELEPQFELVQLREFRFDGVAIPGRSDAPLAWSVLVRRKR